MVLCVVLPVVDVNFRHSGDEKLKLAFIKDGDEVGGDDVVEACDELAEDQGKW